MRTRRTSGPLRGRLGPRGASGRRWPRRRRRRGGRGSRRPWRSRAVRRREAGRAPRGFCRAEPVARPACGRDRRPRLSTMLTWARRRGRPPRVIGVRSVWDRSLGLSWQRAGLTPLAERSHDEPRSGVPHPERNRAGGHRSPGTGGRAWRSRRTMSAIAREAIGRGAGAHQRYPEVSERSARQGSGGGPAARRVGACVANVRPSGCRAPAPRSGSSGARFPPELEEMLSSPPRPKARDARRSRDGCHGSHRPGRGPVTAEAATTTRATHDRKPAASEAPARPQRRASGLTRMSTHPPAAEPATTEAVAEARLPPARSRVEPKPHAEASARMRLRSRRTTTKSAAAAMGREAAGQGHDHPRGARPEKTTTTNPNERPA
jgi:hypothetical protein